MNSWCDKLGSTATVGLRLDWRLIPTETVLASISPALDKMREGDRTSFNIDRQGAFDLSINSNDGLNLFFDQSNFSVTFKHTLQLKNNSAAPPSAKMISTPRPYTELVDVLHDRLNELLPLIPSSNKRTIERIGIVSTTSVSAESAPPGILRFIEYLKRPFGCGMEYFNTSFVVEIAQRLESNDRCVISLSRVEGQQDDLLSVNLDWQRNFVKTRALTNSNLRNLYHDAKIAAIEYFERVGEGGMFDEELISASQV